MHRVVVVVVVGEGQGEGGRNAPVEWTLEPRSKRRGGHVCFLWSDWGHSDGPER